jgi:hypothetical protein
LEVAVELYPVAVVGQVWAKGRAKVEHGEVILDEEDAKEYEVSSPEDAEHMAFELASLPWHRKDEREVKRFVQRHGLLWHGWDDVGSGECHESLDDWWSEVAHLHFVGAFYQAILDSKHDGSAAKVQNFLRQLPYVGFPSLVQSSQHFDQNYIGAASMLLQSLVNEGLNAGPNNGPQALNGRRRCWWGLETVGPGEFRLTQYPPDLLSHAYSAFSVLIATNVETRFCPVCGKQFRPKPRQGECCSPAHQSTYRGWRHKGKL